MRGWARWCAEAGAGLLALVALTVVLEASPWWARVRPGWWEGAVVYTLPPAALAALVLGALGWRHGAGKVAALGGAAALALMAGVLFVMSLQR